MQFFPVPANACARADVFVLLLLPACGEKVGMRGRCRLAQNRGEAPSPSVPPDQVGGPSTSPRAAGRGECKRFSFPQDAFACEAPNLSHVKREAGFRICVAGVVPAVFGP
jgi:hypothetical protein